jgi:RimJ/RimL family protein N-acetyltransferase
METPAETLSDGEVLLRRWRDDDAETVHRMVNGSLGHLAQWMPWAVDGYTEQDAAQFLKVTQAGWRSGESFDYAIIAPDRAVVGSCGLMARIGPGGFEIGYWLGEDYTGRGLVARAAELLTAEAFRVGAERVEIVHDVANTRSGAVPKRLGFTEVTKRAAELRGGTASTGVVAVWRIRDPEALMA